MRTFKNSEASPVAIVVTGSDELAGVIEMLGFEALGSQHEVYPCKP